MKNNIDIRAVFKKKIAEEAYGKVLMTWENPEQLYKLTREELLFLKRHRLLSLLSSVAPTHTGDEEIRSERKKNALHMMKLSSEIISLDKLLREHQIPLLHIKGPVLAAYLYEDVSIKESRDIDLLVPSEKITQAEALLAQRGYTRSYPAFSMTSTQAKRFLGISHHYTYVHPQKKIVLELHWGFFTPQQLYPMAMDEVFAKKIAFRFFDYPLYIPDDKTMLFYLMLHGARHQWFRIAWLADFAELLEQRPQHLAWLVQEANKHKLEAVCTACLTLCQVVLGKTWKTKEHVNKDARYIASKSLQAIFQDEKVLHSGGIEKFRKLHYLLKLKKGISYRYHVMVRTISNQSDWRMLPLPDALFFLYVPLKPLLWLLALVQRKNCAKH